MRKRLFEIIEADDPADGIDLPSTIYDIFMLVIIVMSILPLAFKGHRPIFDIFEKIAFVVFSIDYLLRWSTADYKFGKSGLLSFVRYPFSLMAIIDLLSILPSLTVLNAGFKVLRMLRMMRAMRVLRVLKAVRYSKSLRIIGDVLKEAKEPLIAVATLAIAYIFVSALVIFNAEPDSFRDFFEALYWATVLLTTVGFGDITPVTVIGRGVAMCSSIFGIAIVALPSAIITAGYMRQIGMQSKEEAAVEQLSAGSGETADV